MVVLTGSPMKPAVTPRMEDPRPMSETSARAAWPPALYDAAAVRAEVSTAIADAPPTPESLPSFASAARRFASTGSDARLHAGASSGGSMRRSFIASSTVQTADKTTAASPDTSVNR